MLIEIPDKVKNKGIWNTLVKIRDNYTCQRCKATGSTGSLTAHHTIPVSEDKSKELDVTNGITLCRKCHLVTHNHNALIPEVISQKLNMPVSSIIELLECRILKGYKDDLDGQWRIQQKDFLDYLKSPI